MDDMDLALARHGHGAVETNKPGTDGFGRCGISVKSV